MERIYWIFIILNGENCYEIQVFHDTSYVMELIKFVTQDATVYRHDNDKRERERNMVK